jgi:glutamate racemase
LQSHRNSSIAVFDSGFGGLTVLKELHALLPHEKLTYFGDTANLPYGTKSPQTVLRYTTQNCSFLASQDVKLIVIACNTATSLALSSIANQFSIPLIGVIDPVIEQVIQTSPTGRIGILGTRATVASGVYQKKIEARFPHAQVTAVASPLLVSLVEEGFIDHPMTHLAIEEYIQPLITANVDTVVLACTHFPLLKHLIEKALGPSIQVIDPAFATAQAVRHSLEQLHLLSTENVSPQIRFCVTDDPDKFAYLGPRFLGQPITHVMLSTI